MSDQVKGAWPAVLEVLRQHGAGTLFGLPGDDLELLDAIERADDPPRLVLCRDQRNALFMATGHALQSGTVTAAVVGKGPAVTNAATGLLEAQCSRAPVVLIGAGTDPHHIGARAFQELDQVSALAPLTKWAHRVEHADRLVPALRRALLMAAHGAPGPVYLEVPDHLLAADIPLRGRGLEPTAGVPHPVRAAERPILLVGGGMRHRNAERVVERLAERIGAAIFCTASGRGAVDEDHPQFLGLSGLYAAPATAQLWSTSDCVISLGSRLEETATLNWPEPIGDSVPVVQLNIVAEEFATDHSGPCVIGDAAATVEAWLTDDLGGDRGEWAELINAARQELRPRVSGELRIPDLLAEVQRVVPQDRILVQENGLQDMWSYFFPNYSCGLRGGSVVPSEQTSLGFGAAAAAGVKAAAPHRPVLALVGDGAFALFAADLRTLVRERLGVCYLVLRNGGYGWLQQQADQHEPPITGFAFTDDEPLVRTPGVHHALVERPDDLGPALADAMRLTSEGTPCVIEVPVTLDDSALRPDGDFGTPPTRCGAPMISENIRPLRRRVVVTGVGAVTPVGLTFDATWEAFLAGRSGVAEISTFDASDLPTSIAGQIKDFDATEHMPRTIARRMDSYAQYAMAAATQAQQMSTLDIDEGNADRIGVLIGSGYGAVNSIDGFSVAIREKGPRAISPYAPITGAIDSAAGEISMAFGARGPSRAISSACATGTDALGEAARWIQFGLTDAVIVGGADNCVTRVDLAGSGNARALSRRVDDPQAASRPFDEDRDGFVMSAGAGVLVLEEAELAERRGATILAEVLGYGCSSDAYHWTAPQPEGLGAKRAMRSALADAGVEPGRVDHVNAHGTSTKLNDASEVASLREVLGARATEIPICSIKSMTGHMIGAAGAVEAITAVQTIRTGIVPPTINCHRPLADDMNFVPNEPQQHEVRVAMSNSFGFGGHNAVVVLGAWEG